MAARFESGALESYGAVESAGAGVTVPDATLLFTGDFSRAGGDLVLTGSDGAKFVVTGYFDSASPPPLMSPEGAMLTGGVVTALAGPQFPGQYAQAGGTQTDAQGAQAIGKVTTLDGSATVVRANGTTETLEVGGAVFQGDVMQTGAGSKLGIGFIDGTVFSMSANARMVLNSLIYNPDGADNSMLFSLVEGTFVFAAGKIAPTGDMKINTPVATMGIRGTTPTVTIDSQTGTVNFSIVPDPGTGHVGSYTLYSLTTGQSIGTITDAGSYWQLTSTDGTVTQIPKSDEDLLKDQDAISDINNVFNSWTNSQGPQAGPDGNPPNSSGFNSESQPDGPNNNQNNNQNNNENNENDPPPADQGNNNNQTNNDPPPVIDDPQDVGVNVINGSGEIFGTDGNDIIFGSDPDPENEIDGVDIIAALDGNDFVFAKGGDDTIIGGTGGGDDTYDGGEGSDTLKYTSTGEGEGVTIDLTNNTVTGPATGTDTFESIEKFIGGSGDDTLIIDADTGWVFDGGDGRDTIKFEGDLNIDVATVQSDAINYEIIDLNKTHNNTFSVALDDFFPEGEGIGQGQFLQGEEAWIGQQGGQGQGDQNTLQFRGGEGDTLILNNNHFNDFDFDNVEFEDLFELFISLFGRWEKSEETHYENEGTADQIAFDVWEFKVDFEGETVIARAQVERGEEQGIKVLTTQQIGGTENDDTLFGSQANDIMSGGELDDAVFGGNGDDGNDLIVGDPVQTTSAETIIPSTGDALTVSLNTLDATNGEALILTGFISQGAIEQQDFNIAFVVDTSGSTIGDVLAAEKDAIEALYNSIVNTPGIGNLNVTLIAFNSDAEQVFTGPANQNGDSNEEPDFLDALGELGASGGTNFKAALSEAATFFGASAAAAANIVFFLSDGAHGADFGSFEDEVETLTNPQGINATIRAFGIGDNPEQNEPDLNQLNQVDSDDAEHVQDPQNLSASLIDSGIEIDRLEFLIGDKVVGTLSGEELVESGPFGLRYDFLLTGLDPTQADQVTVRVVATDDQQTTVETTQTVEQHNGIAGHDLLIGGDDDDLLIGGDGNDILFGDEGDDVLIGGVGSDQQFGGNGSDTYVFASLSEAGDIIHDFDAQADALDLTGLLKDAFGQGAEIGQLVRATTTVDPETEEASTTISVDPDGDGPEPFTDIAVLKGIGDGVEITVLIGEEDPSVTSTPVPVTG